MWGDPHIPLAAELNALSNVDERGGGVNSACSSDTVPRTSTGIHKTKAGSGELREQLGADHCLVNYRD
jgi:hypothetical protein